MAPERDLWCSEKIKEIVYDYWTEFIKFSLNIDLFQDISLINNLTKDVRKKLNFQIKKELQIQSHQSCLERQFK